jgi:uncharacterized protein (TIGR02172 family)
VFSVFFVPSVLKSSTLGAMDTLEAQPETPIAIGVTSELLNWDNGRVVKLCFDWVRAETVEREFNVTRALHAAGLPVPAAYELVQVKGRWGIVFERIEGPSMLKQVEKRPWQLFSAARRLAELHARLHELAAPPQLPSQRDQINRWMDGATTNDFPPARKEAARAVVAHFGEGKVVCHGDFHPANILLTARGPIIIDWSTGTRGHAEGDVARTCVLFEKANLPPQALWYMHIMLKLARRLLHATYLKRYLALRPGKLDAINRWLEPQRAFQSAWYASRGRSE